MKRLLGVVLAVLLLITCLSAEIPMAHASTKAGQSRAIAIVFDNSGSMYIGGNKAWCRATYAMEVFASMLNEGDTLLIYPMHPIEVGGKEYTMQNPYRLSDASQASSIRGIYTAEPGGTPIESIDYAAAGLKNVQADKKYMIVLTDGGTFSENNIDMTKSSTRAALDKRFEEYAGKTMTTMYLGIGGDACMPSKADSEFFVKKQAVNSADVLSTLTLMCNQIFGRDSMPKNHISGNTVDFDISMTKLIVFVQGENISGLKVTGSNGNPVGRQTNSQQTKYATNGCGMYTSVEDKSLQGMMVTYMDCPAGTYNIEYTGTASSVEIYYEPNAELDFVFTDLQGNTVDPMALYEGEYKVSFGMKDATTGKLISSDLLGNPVYAGSYFLNGEEFKIDHEGYNGEVTVSLNVDDVFEANMTATFLSGYTISKDSSDFGWPPGGIKVVNRPAGDLRLEITGGAELYSLQNLAEGEPYVAKIYHQGELLTGKELEKVELKWDPSTSNAEIKKTFADDHWLLTLHYKDPEAPQDTVCGECTVSIYAFYAAKGSSEAQAECSLTYNINDDFSPLQMELFVPENYIVISELENSKPIVVNLKINGERLTPEDFAMVQMQVDTNGLEYTLTPKQEDSAYEIQLLPTEGLEDGSYDISITGLYTDEIGRTTQVDDGVSLTLSSVPLWVKWCLTLLGLLLLILIIVLILRIRVLPTKAHVTKRDSTMTFDGEDETKSTTFDCKIQKGKMDVSSKFAGVKTGLTMEVKPGKESFLSKPQARRSAEVKSSSLRKVGGGTIQEVTIGSIKYTLNEETNKLERAPKTDKPFEVKHGMRVSYSGTMMNAGVPKPFTVTTKLNFKKK